MGVKRPSQGLWRVRGSAWVRLPRRDLEARYTAGPPPCFSWHLPKITCFQAMWGGLSLQQKNKCSTLLTHATASPGLPERCSLPLP